MKKKHRFAVVIALTLASAPSLITRADAEDDAGSGSGPIGTAAKATVEGKYDGPGGEQIEISTEFGEATWGQVFKKLAGENDITWTKTEPNDAGTTGVQATFVPDGAPKEIVITMFLLHGADGVRFDRMKMSQGDESREKSGLEALEAILDGYKDGGDRKGSAIGVLNKNQAKQLILGCMIYAADNGGAFPPDFDALLKAGAIEEKLQWRNPETDRRSDFLYHGAGKHNTDRNTTVIIAAPEPVGGKRTVAQADGAVLDLPEADYQKAIK